MQPTRIYIYCGRWKQLLTKIAPFHFDIKSAFPVPHSSITEDHVGATLRALAQPKAHPASRTAATQESSQAGRNHQIPRVREKKKQPTPTAPHAVDSDASPPFALRAINAGPFRARMHTAPRKLNVANYFRLRSIPSRINTIHGRWNRKWKCDQTTPSPSSPLLFWRGVFFCSRF